MKFQERLAAGGSGSASLVYKSLTRMAILSVSLSFRVFFVFIYLIFSTWIPFTNRYCNMIITCEMIFLLVFFVGPSRLVKITGWWFYQDLLDSKVSAMNKKGDFLLAVGSPFGVLSPMHFFNRYYYYIVWIKEKKYNNKIWQLLQKLSNSSHLFFVTLCQTISMSCWDHLCVELYKQLFCLYNCSQCSELDCNV